MYRNSNFSIYVEYSFPFNILVAITKRIEDERKLLSGIIIKIHKSRDNLPLEDIQAIRSSNLLMFI